MVAEQSPPYHFEQERVMGARMLVPNVRIGRS